MSREKIQPTVEIRNRPIAANKGERRPYLSLNGPKTNCPIASPTILVVSPNCTFEDVVWKKSDIAGKVGRYMSITNGPKALNIPKNTNMKPFEFCLPVIIFPSFKIGGKIIPYFPNSLWLILYKTFHFRNNIQYYH